MNFRINESNVPLIIRNCPKWVVWKKESRNGRLAKRPFDGRSGYPGDICNKNIYMSLEDALIACEKFDMDGIGFVFAKEDGLIGLDLDKCIIDERLTPVAEDIVNQCDSYTELSPSGKGLHIILRGKLPEGARRNSDLGIEIYDDKRYFTWTGKIFRGKQEVEERSQEIAEIHQKYFIGSKLNEAKQEAKFNLGDTDILSKAMRGKNGTKVSQLFIGNWQEYYKSQSEAELALCSMLAFWTNKSAKNIDDLFRQSGLYRKKWEERHFGNGKTYGQVTIEKAIEMCSAVYQEECHDKNSKPKNLDVNKKPEWYVENSKGKMNFVPGLLAQHMFKNHIAVYAGGIIYLYKTGVYSEIEDKQALKLIQEKMIIEYLKASQVRDVLDLWKNMIYKKIEELNGESISHIINFRNGLYDVYENKFYTHSPDVLSTIQNSCNFDQDSECQLFMKYINQALPEDCVPLAQEILGYLLVPFTKAQTAFILFGPPRTGKSTFLRIIEDIIGKQNIANIAWQDLGERFKTASLFGKMANIFADLPNRPIEESSVFKTLTGEDTITVEKKFGDPFSFQNKARLIFSCNELPQNYADRTDAFYRRLIILPFKNKVSKDEIDTRLNEKLHKEIDGIAQWALQGLLRLIANDFKFTETNSTKELLEQYKIDSDNVLWFLNEFCMPNPTSEILTINLYRRYSDTCSDLGMKAVSMKKFTQVIDTRFKGIISREKESKTRKSLLKGISLI